jgi:hypothetical protein
MHIRAVSHMYIRHPRESGDDDGEKLLDGPHPKHLSIPLRKNFPLFFLRKSAAILVLSCPTEGRLAIVTDAGQDAVDVECQARFQRVDE